MSKLSTKVENIMEQLRDLRESKLNPCRGEDVQGICPCHSFDFILDKLEQLKKIGDK